MKGIGLVTLLFLPATSISVSITQRTFYQLLLITASDNLQHKLLQLPPKGRRIEGFIRLLDLLGSHRSNNDLCVGDRMVLVPVEQETEYYSFMGT
jgi:hypothetical protein